MRIARPRKPDVAFKRKRGPPPQATKLLRTSMIAGIVFMILLGVVFLPRMFGDRAPVATRVELTFVSSTRLEVVSVGALVSLSKLQATLRQDTNSTPATLGPPLSGANGTLSFSDANGDGALGPGDFFTVSVAPTGCHHVDIFQIEPALTFLVGQEIWGGCSST